MLNESNNKINEFNNKINKLKGDYLAGQDKEIEDVLGNASLVYNNQLKLLDQFIYKNK